MLNAERFPTECPSPPTYGQVISILA